LIQVARLRLNGATKVPDAKAASAMASGNAWYTVIAQSVYAARIWR
jgi:hypothetical protein